MSNQYVVLTDINGWPVCVSRLLNSFDEAQEFMRDYLPSMRLFVCRVVYGETGKEEMN